MDTDSQWEDVGVALRADRKTSAEVGEVQLYWNTRSKETITLMTRALKPETAVFLNVKQLGQMMMMKMVKRLDNKSVSFLKNSCCDPTHTHTHLWTDCKCSQLTIIFKLKYDFLSWHFGKITNVPYCKDLLMNTVLSLSVRRHLISLLLSFILSQWVMLPSITFINLSRNEAEQTTRAAESLSVPKYFTCSHEECETQTEMKMSLSYFSSGVFIKL